jgi:nucleotide-binding universal stress UspA family protein
MTEQDKIIFSTDFSDESLAALTWARKMCEDLDAELHCITAVQEPVVFYPVMAQSAAALPSIEGLTNYTQTELDAFVKEHLDLLAKPPVAKVLIGRPSDEIVRYADEINATMIVMATHGHSGAARIFIGSTTEDVVRQAKCPVLTVRIS